MQALSRKILMHVFPSVIASLILTTVFAAQSGEVVPNENLVVDGIPKIPSSIAESVDRYSNFRSANLASWHPTRREMLIATRFADVSEIHRVTCRAGRARS